MSEVEMLFEFFLALLPWTPVLLMAWALGYAQGKNAG